VGGNFAASGDRQNPSSLPPSLPIHPRSSVSHDERHPITAARQVALRGLWKQKKIKKETKRTPVLPSLPPSLPPLLPIHP